MYITDKKSDFFWFFWFFWLYLSKDFIFSSFVIMKRKLLWYLLGGVFAMLFGFWWLYNNVYAECKWIKLNTNFPIVWNCIGTSSTVNATNAFPAMVWALTKLIMALILVVCFILVIIAWIQRSADKPKEAKELLKKVAITILLLWFSGVILRLVNPNFFS